MSNIDKQSFSSSLELSNKIKLCQNPMSNKNSKNNDSKNNNSKNNNSKNKQLNIDSKNNDTKNNDSNVKKLIQFYENFNNRFVDL